jgi:class 3 adenylate cyclase
VLSEPVRGGFPDRSFFALTGIEQACALQRGLVPRVPLGHLVGHRLSQVGSGTAAGTIPATPWLQGGDGTMEVRISMAAGLDIAVLTGLAPGCEASMAALSVTHLRVCTLESAPLIARARVLHSGPILTFAEALAEDAHGRGVAHATASVIVRAIEPPPPEPFSPLQPVEEPVYPSPDPHLRPLPPGVAPYPVGQDEHLDGIGLVRALMSGDIPTPPVWALVGLRGLDVTEGEACLSFAASEWFCSRTREVHPGVIACAAHAGLTAAAITLAPPAHRIGVIHQTIDFTRSVAADGRQLLVRCGVVHQDGDLLIVRGEVTDADGKRVALGQQSSILISEGEIRPAPQRILTTVLFTDLVGSTLQAQRLGDARWGELLERHHGLVRRQLEIHKGREIKTTGDGFLATFDSPTRAVHCARAIRDGVRRLDLDVRTGIHSGECEMVGGDVAGVAVHAASRIVSAAGAGEILVSTTVRDLVAGSGLRLSDGGTHELRGLEGNWQLFTVEG